MTPDQPGLGPSSIDIDSTQADRAVGGQWQAANDASSRSGQMRRL